MIELVYITLAVILMLACIANVIRSIVKFRQRSIEEYIAEREIRKNLKNHGK